MSFALPRVVLPTSKASRNVGKIAEVGVRALLEHSDFLAIGTNDLAQYVLAADRGNDALDNIYTPLQPALLRLLSHVIGAGRRAR